MRISYGITVCNELEEIRRLIDRLLVKKRKQDEIVVLVDATKAPDELISTLRHYERHNMDHMTVWADNFEGHFADWKNKLTSYCTGEYIFQIDADEVPSNDLIEILPAILESNPTTEMYLVPRVNTVEGITPEHIQRWRWNVNQMGWINFPDYQCRIYKNNKVVCWKNKVHEILTNYKEFAQLPPEHAYCLYHHKDILRQEKQNNYYNTL